MASGTTRGRVDLVFFPEPGPQSFLGLLGFPSKVRNLVFGAEDSFGIAMTIQAPAHAQGFHLADFFHLIHATVAGDAAHPPGHMGTMVELHVIGEVMHFDPRDPLSGHKALANKSQLWALGSDPSMTVHACLRRRNSG